MTINLLQYESNGRTFIDTENPSQRIYKTSIGEKNISDGQGGFAPFILNGAEINYGTDVNGLEFTTDQQILKRASQIICSSFKFFVQAFVVDQWVTQPHGTANREFRQGQVFRDGGWVDDPQKCTGYLTFPDAHVSFGAQLPYNLQIGLEAGGSNRSRLGFRFRGPASGQVRFVIVLDGLEKLPTDWEWIEVNSTRLGIRVKDLVWKWNPSEAPYRDIVAEDNPDNTKKISIILGNYDYTADEWLTVFPDTFGPSETTDDCLEGNDTTYYDNDTSLGGNGGVAVGNFSGIYDIGLLFSNVTASGTANDGCKLTVHNTIYYFGSSVLTNIRICNVDSPAAWGTTNRPSQQALHATIVAWDSPADSQANLDSPEIKTLIQDRFDDAQWSSGSNLAIVILDDGSSGSNLWAFDSEEGGVGAQLTIVYTPAGGGGFNASFAINSNSVLQAGF